MTWVAAASKAKRDLRYTIAILNLCLPGDGNIFAQIENHREIFIIIVDKFQVHVASTSIKSGMRQDHGDITY